jgi:hypothetical protein
MELIPKCLLGTVAAILLCFSSYGIFAVAGDGPEEITIDSLAQLYEPVQFPHAMHEEVVDGQCGVCHHHTLGTGVVDENCVQCHAESGATDEISCQECHAAKRFDAEYLSELGSHESAYHIDRLGLKAAYHTRCLNCHTEMDVATGCQDCHVRNDAGDKFFHAGKYAPPEGAKPAGGGHN